MPWSLRRGRRSATVATREPSTTDSTPPSASLPRHATGGAWAHLDPIPTPTATPPLTFHGERFGRSVAGARSMVPPAIPPLHHRHGPDAPSGVLPDVASATNVVGRPSMGDHTSDPHTSVGDRLPEFTPRQLPLDARRDDRGSRDFLRSDLVAPFNPSRPARLITDDVRSMSWDAEHGFRLPDTSPSTLRMVRRRRPTGSADAPASVDGGGEPGTWSSSNEQRATGHPPEHQPAESERAEFEPADFEPATVRYVPAAGPRIERPPSDLVDAVREATGIDLSGARIDRSAEVTDRAASMGALAFTDGDTVHLPAELGPHDEGPTRAVLAHELVHVAQQRAFGGRPPAEGTPEGIELEHQARAVQRSIGDRLPVVPTFLRTAPPTTTAPAGVQRLAPDDDHYDWQQRGAPPSQRGARAAFGLAFLRVEPDSAEWRERTTSDQQWARGFEADHATVLQGRRDERYAEMIDEAERELQIQNLREERKGAELLELERHDILALRRSLDSEMPWEFGPPPGLDRLYPNEPELPAEEAPAIAPALASPSTTSTADHELTVPDAPSIGRDSAARRTASPLRHPLGSSGAARGELDVAWQRRASTSREQIGAVFGGALGALLSSTVSDGDDEAERRRAEAAPAIMQRRQARESELRHVELRSLAIAARRDDTAGPATAGHITLRDEAITEIRARVDTEMPLEFVMPEYLDRTIDVVIDAEGTVGSAPAESASEQALLDDATNAASDTTGDTLATLDIDGAPESATDGSLTTPVERAQEPTAPAPATTSGPTSPIARVGAGVGAGVALGALATHIDDDPDDHALAGRVFDAASDLDLEKLSRRLYGRFRRDLRRELLIDRERAGTLADAC